MKQIFWTLVLTITFMGYVQGAEQVDTDKPPTPIKQSGVLGSNSFNECVAVTMWLITGKSLNADVNNSEQDNAAISAKNGPFGILGSSNPAIKIPKGWSVVGTGVSNEPILFICH
jgi:hypothetical protein